MNKRFTVERVEQGHLELDATQGRHLRDVLRLGVGDAVEVFDAAGRSAMAQIIQTDGAVILDVGAIQAAVVRPALIVAASVPKGSRADWLVEKLTEVGVTTYIPLLARRSVVHPEAGKLQRWGRLASEAAKQCHRTDVMGIDVPQSLTQVLAQSHLQGATRWCLSTGDMAVSFADCPPVAGQGALLLVGPEGGWCTDELDQMTSAGCVPVRLTQTVLRIETAAILAAGMVSMAQTGAAALEPSHPSP